MKNKKLDTFGILCGAFLVVVLIANILLGNANARANQPKIPETAQTYATSAQGIFSEVKVETIADADGIYSVKVTEHGETPELGGVAAEELPGKIVEAQSVEIDGVAGATMTSNAIKTAVTEALLQAGFMEAPAVEEPAEEEPAAEETAAAVEAPEGAQTYTVSAPGVFGEPVELEVVADENGVYSVVVTSHNETQGIGSNAVAELPGKIVETQSVDVDGVAGATMTSNAIKTAVTEALTQAGFLAAAESEAAAEETAEEAVEAAAVEEPAETAEETAAEGGVLTASAPGVFGEPVVVEVEADENGIYSVVVTENNETQGIGSIAVAELPDKIVAAQSVDIDGVAGATMTSNAIKTAVLAALTEAGIDSAGFAAPAAEAAPEAEVEKTPVTLECDVVVVGAGGAGLTSAVRATQEGANVLVLEKMPIVGGNSLRAEGGMNAAETRVQAELGLDDSTIENYIADTLRLGHDLADPDLVRTLAEGGAEAIDWLESIGAPLTKVAATGGTEHKYLHKPEDGQAVGAYLVQKLSEQVDQLGINVMLNTRATEILMENGQAVGVIAEDKEHIYTVKAKSVVLATGGFGANFELMASYDPSLADAVTTNHAGATGDGIAMAEAIGAATVDMEQIQLHPTVIQSNGLLVSESLRSHGAIIVNAEGKRFVNDMAGRDVVSQAELKQPGAYAFIIFDQALVDEVALTHKFIDGGYAVSGDTYEALAESMGLESEAVQNFVETMQNWETYVAAGEDKDFGRSQVSMIDISTAPYYAIKIAPGIHHTMGGIKINTSAQVVSTEGEVIPGLFACGETTGGIHGGNRVGGNAVADFTIFGRIAGASAAAYAGGEPVEAAAEEPAAEAEPAAAALYVPGTYSGEAYGMSSNVKVTLTVDENGITDVVLDTTGETQGIGAAHDEEFIAQILESGAEIDGVTGASMTSQAIRLAVSQALAEAVGTGETEAKALVADGTYNGKAPSYGVMKEMELAVTFKDNAITAIETVCAGSATQADEDEYSPIYATVEANLFPRIIDAQSLAVDSITGATVSSSAAKLIIAQIIDANGGKSSEWYTPIEKSDEVVVLEDYDVVVVGLGASGMASYISAAENGATVFGMEAAAKIGGNGTNTAGPLGVNPPHQVEANGGEPFVDPDELFEAWMEYTDGDAKEEIVRLFIEESGATFAWLQDNWGFQFLPSMFAFYDYHGWPLWTMYMDKDNAYNTALTAAKAMNEKNDYKTELTAKALLTDADGKVVGVEAEYYDGTTYQIYGDSVILASGGYIGNAEMTQKYTGAVWHTKGMTQCNGFGISEALKLGGALYNEDVAVEDHIAQLDTIVRSDDYSNDDKGILTSLVLDLNYQLIDSEGKDFDANYNGLGIAFNAWEAGANYYVLINEEEYNSIKDNGLIAYNAPMFFNQGGTYEEGTPVSNLDEIMAMGQKFNDVIIADSLEDLENQLGIDIQLDDVHGQTEGKLWCIKGAAYVYSTCGGMDVDTNINLLKEDGTPVENVYVVGNESLGTLNESNKAYVTYGGCAQGWALTSGRLAGANAAAKYASSAAVEAAAEEAPAEEAEEAAAEPQTYTVSKPGVFGEPVVVEVVADANTIYSVVVVENNETQGIGSIAVAELPGKIVEAQSADVDGVAGATMTSTAIRTAVAEALAEAGFAA